MFDFIKKHFRKQALRRSASKAATAITPLPGIRTAVVFLDAGEESADVCRKAITAFFREHDIKGNFRYFDLESEATEDDAASLLLKTDLDWIGKPSAEKADAMLDGPHDLFISMATDGSFASEFIAVRAEAKFKIGRTQSFGKVFDFVVNDPSGRTLSQSECFEVIKTYLEKIK